MTIFFGFLWHLEAFHTLRNFFTKEAEYLLVDIIKNIRFLKKKSNYSDWSMEKQTYLGKLIPNPIQKPYRNWVFLGGEIIVGMQIILSISQMI